MRYLTAALLLTSTFLVPATTLQADDHRDRNYNRNSRDRHEWNEREAKAHRRYWEENRKRRAYREFQRNNAREQRDYWRWRRSHSDSILWP